MPAAVPPALPPFMPPPVPADGAFVPLRALAFTGAGAGACSFPFTGAARVVAAGVVAFGVLVVVVAVVVDSFVFLVGLGLAAAAFVCVLVRPAIGC